MQVLYCNFNWREVHVPQSYLTSIGENRLIKLRIMVVCNSDPILTKIMKSRKLLTYLGSGGDCCIRGVSCTFGPNIVDQVLKKHNLDLIVRAHQVVQVGYEFFHNRKLVTLFSAPHYCGQFDNAAAVMMVDEDLRCSFKILRPKFLSAQCKATIAADLRDITCYKQI
ncbi:unnamed protein product, partial [Mesorhabditis belari]|uniref:Serine/threonine specific protein phosphatases domain-containing protein n=1 Tax=Mesorhabditis belari TaxID=2138241 RepID=A0AAF3FH57_9BILA